MPKITEIIGWVFAVGERIGPDGTEKVVMFQDPASGEQIRIPLSDDARLKLVQGLTGGVHLAASIKEARH